MSSLNDIKLTFTQQQEFSAVLKYFKKEAYKYSISIKKDDLFLGNKFVGKLDNPTEIGKNIISILAKDRLVK